MDKVSCHFSNSGASLTSHAQCQGDATSFIRKSHDNRLCPLCDYCRGTFVKAQETMDPKVKESLPGQVVFTDVPLSDASIAEFEAQPKKERAGA